MRGSVTQHPAHDYRQRVEEGGPSAAHQLASRFRTVLAVPQQALMRARSHVHTWTLEAALETGESASGDIDGELYVSPGRRGNVRGVCECGKARLFRPFVGMTARVAQWEGVAS